MAEPRNDIERVAAAFTKRINNFWHAGLRLKYDSADAPSLPVHASQSAGAPGFDSSIPPFVDLNDIAGRAMPCPSQ